MADHLHDWRFYRGCLGYESFVCTICGADCEDVAAKISLEELRRF